MKKILILTTLLSTICFADTSYAEHEAQMSQMRVQTQNSNDSGQKKQNRYQYGKSSTQDSSGNQYKGSKGKGGKR